MHGTSSQHYSVQHGTLYLISPGEAQIQSGVLELLSAEEIPAIGVDAGEPSVDQLALMDTMAVADALGGVAWSPEDMTDLIEGAR